MLKARHFFRLGKRRGREMETSGIFTVDSCLFSFDPPTCGAVERCKDV